jgi:hypothetical protein
MNTQSTPAKETKAQRAERLKAAKNPWQALEELQRYARLGYEAAAKASPRPTSW